MQILYASHLRAIAWAWIVHIKITILGSEIPLQTEHTYTHIHTHTYTHTSHPAVNIIFKNVTYKQIKF